MPEIGKKIEKAESADCEEKPGGVKFQVILEDAKTSDVPEMRSPPTPSPSVEDIELKLKAAEDRRKSMEASALEKLAEKEKRAEEVRAKKASLKGENSLDNGDAEDQEPAKK
eukprot:TRINITY_DN24045_c0_g1_i1.p1 TRINITY_DN24045_c0_g1~~TRINITY_DN24045_c0_g1_i1.p1  ORF type:complete len:112 (+),score=59.58 TRINITY_DN24045_c0_g1_i1:23-358(+)